MAKSTRYWLLHHGEHRPVRPGPGNQRQHRHRGQRGNTSNTSRAPVARLPATARGEAEIAIAVEV
uniref:Uncharacterized protein n=1 Tax=Arundo donax TaxID=35708 RepID=A0A0A9GT96_ARUDO